MRMMTMFGYPCPHPRPGVGVPWLFPPCSCTHNLATGHIAKGQMVGLAASCGRADGYYFPQWHPARRRDTAKAADDPRWARDNCPGQSPIVAPFGFWNI